MNPINEDRVKVIKLYGEVIEGETLIDLQKQAGDLDAFDTLVVEIASPGGSVSEGLEIMCWLDNLSAQGKRIVTCVVANSYSIASLIMLAADMRLISKHGEVMVHNPMVPQLEYANANDLQQYVDSLRDLEGLMYELYQVFTGLDQETIKSLMDNETYLSPDDAVKYGFAETVVDIKQKSFEMTANFKTDINMSKTFNILNKVIAMVNKSEYVNQLYYTQDGSEVEIFQADPSTYKVGDKCDMPDGDVQLSDGSIVTVKDGVVKDINRDVEVAPIEETTAVEGEEATIVEEAIEETPIAPIEEEAPEAPVTKEKDAMPASVVEVTESVTTKETLAEVPQAVVEAPAVEAPVSEFNEGPAPKEMVAEETEMVAEETEMVAEETEMVAEETEMVAEEVDMKETEMYKMFEEMMNAYKTEMNSKFEAINAKISEGSVKSEKFEALVTEAVDSIATSTASNFVPGGSKSDQKNQASGSLFTQLKQKRGLK